jgi:hypothetical protein
VCLQKTSCNSCIGQMTRLRLSLGLRRSKLRQRIRNCKLRREAGHGTVGKLWQDGEYKMEPKLEE